MLLGSGEHSNRCDIKYCVCALTTTLVVAALALPLLRLMYSRRPLQRKRYLTVQAWIRNAFISGEIATRFNTVDNLPFLASRI